MPATIDNDHSVFQTSKRWSRRVVTDRRNEQ
jgi:hypothetical protein